MNFGVVLMERRDLSIEYTVFARSQIQEVEHYLSITFGQVAVDRFRGKILNFERAVCRFPYSFKQVSIEVETRFAVVSKQTSLVYLVENERIVVLALWDNRMKV